MFPFFILLANPVTSLSGMNGSPNPLTLPGSGTMVFPLPGSFPWAAGARGKMVPVFESFFLDFRHSIIWKVIPTDIKISVSKLQRFLNVSLLPLLTALETFSSHFENLSHFYLPHIA